MFGRRSDGKRIKNLSPYRQFFPYILDTRAESQAYFSQKIVMDRTLAYLEKVNAGAAEKKLSLFQIFLAAGVRTMALRPQLNRFVKGRFFYQRNTIDISFVVKKQLKEEAGVSTAKITFDPHETLASVIEKTKKQLKFRRSDKKSQEEKELDLTVKFPRWVIRLIAKGFRMLDYFGLAPKKMIKSDPMFASVFIANLGSIGMDAPFHHLFDWGTASLFVTIGQMHKEPMVNEKDEIEIKNIITANFTLDNRVTDGMYCAKAIQLFVKFVQNPEQLEQPPQLVEDQT
jgi:hypothetical protein